MLAFNNGWIVYHDAYGFEDVDHGDEIESIGASYEFIDALGVCLEVLDLIGVELAEESRCECYIGNCPDYETDTGFIVVFELGDLTLNVIDEVVDDGIGFGICTGCIGHEEVSIVEDVISADFVAEEGCILL